MLSLLDLEPEICFLIVEFLDDSSPKSIKAVACVNKYFNEVTKVISHRHKTVVVDDLQSATKLINSWVVDESILANIRTLTVKGYKTDVRPSKLDHEFWKPLVTLLSRTGRLRQLNWSVKVPVPIVVLDALEKHQTASELRIFNFVRNPDDGAPTPVEQRLAKSPALTHLRYDNKNSSDGGKLCELAFKFIAGSAPNLIYVGLLRSWLPHFATTGHYNPPAHQVSFGDSFDMIDKPNSAVRQLTLDGVDITKELLDEWSSIIDLSLLHNVKFSRGTPTLSYLQCAAGALPNLKHLSLNLYKVQTHVAEDERHRLSAAVADYINNCSPLQTLSLWSWMGIVSLPDLLRRHGQSLRNLQLHEREEIEKHRRVLDIAAVADVRNNCPHLREFTFDLNREDPSLLKEPDTKKLYFEELAKIPNLNAVQIYLDVGVDSIDQSCNLDPDASEYFSEEDDEEEEEEDNNPDGDEDEEGDVDGNEMDNDRDDRNSISSQPPPPKRQRLARPTRPSNTYELTAYATSIWEIVFGNRLGGTRRLDLKAGEWEGRRTGIEWEFRRYAVVKPHERDDVHEPTVQVHRLRESEI